MRIRDWSSDVCSSDLLVLGARWVEGRQDGALSLAAGMALAKIAEASPDGLKQRIDEAGPVRKGVVWGQSVAGRVDLGGRRIFQKTKHCLLSRISTNDQRLNIKGH